MNKQATINRYAMVYALEKALTKIKEEIKAELVQEYPEGSEIPSVAKNPTLNGMMDTLALMVQDFVPKTFRWQRREVKEWDLQKFRAMLGAGADLYVREVVNAPALEVALKQGTLSQEDLKPAYTTKTSYALVTG